MLKHIEDDGDLSILVNDEGAMLVLCSQRHHWIGKLSARQDADEAVVDSIATTLATHSDLAAAAGIGDADFLR
jgi:hypothetical protein